eukprot:1160679-Pelagomonas_calceolata.AAC.17
MHRQQLCRTLNQYGKCGRTPCPLCKAANSEAKHRVGNYSCVPYLCMQFYNTVRERVKREVFKGGEAKGAHRTGSEGAALAEGAPERNPQAVRAQCWQAMVPASSDFISSSLHSAQQACEGSEGTAPAVRAQKCNSVALKRSWAVDSVHKQKTLLSSMLNLNFLPCKPRETFCGPNKTCSIRFAVFKPSVKKRDCWDELMCSSCLLVIGNRSYGACTVYSVQATSQNA